MEGLAWPLAAIVITAITFVFAMNTLHTWERLHQAGSEPDDLKDEIEELRAQLSRERESFEQEIARLNDRMGLIQISIGKGRTNARETP